MTFILILSFSFIAAPLYVKFRDLSQIWEVAIQALFYGSPIVYPLQIIPVKYHTILLANPIGFIIHFNKLALTENHYPTLMQISVFSLFVVTLFFVSLFVFRKMEPKIANRIFRNVLVSLFIYALPILLMLLTFYLNGERPWEKKQEPAAQVSGQK